MLNFIKKIFSIFSIFLIFNLTFVNSAQAGPSNVTTASVGAGGGSTAIKPQAIAFNGNGEKMFVLHNRTPSSGASSNFDRVEEYDLGTGFDYQDFVESADDILENDSAQPKTQFWRSVS